MTVIPKEKGKTLYHCLDCYVLAKNRDHAIKLREKWLKERAT